MTKTVSGETPFAGFTEALPGFLRELGRNNTREWFQAHKQEFTEVVAVPLAALAHSLAADMDAIDPELVCRVSRPHRDTRFSSDKSPYRTAMWFTYRHPQTQWTDKPAFFFETTPEQCRWGMGFFAARPATMSALRDAVVERPHDYLAALKTAAQRNFVLDGDPYKRPPPVPDGTAEPIADLYRRRNAYFSLTMGYDAPELRDAGFGTVLAADFEALAAMYSTFMLVND